MMRAGLIHWHTTTAACRDRAARELSKWSRATLVATIGFGTILMLIGSLFTCGLAMSGYEQLNRRGIGDSDYGEVIRFWANVLLVFGGDFIRAVGWRELRRRRPGATTSATTGAPASRVSIVMGVLIAPVMLFWGALGVVSVVRGLQFFMSRPPWARPSWGTIQSQLDIWRVTVWWLLTMACLAGGVTLIWRGMHALTRRPTSSS